MIVNQPWNIHLELFLKSNWLIWSKCNKILWIFLYNTQRSFSFKKNESNNHLPWSPHKLCLYFILIIASSLMIAESQKPIPIYHSWGCEGLFCNHLFIEVMKSSFKDTLYQQIIIYMSYFLDKYVCKIIFILSWLQRDGDGDVNINYFQLFWNF